MALRVALSVLLWVSMGQATSRPAGGAAASRPAEERIETLAASGEGDWAVYRVGDGAERLEVVHRTRLLAEIEVRTVLAGKPVGLASRRTVWQSSDYALDLAEAEGAQVQFSQDTIDVAGRRWRCRRTVATWASGERSCERHVWMNADVPVYGLVRMELRVDGRPAARMDLADFGRGAATTRPAS